MTGPRRIGRLLRLSSVERDVDEEIAFHLESRVASLVACGVSADEARRRATREFGDVDASRRELTEVDRQVRTRQRGAAVRDALVHDFRFTFRVLRRNLGLATMVVLLLALGVGANAAVFAVANTLFLRPPAGVRDAQSVERLYLRTTWSVGGETTIRTEFFYPAFASTAAALGAGATLAGYTAPDSLSTVIDGAQTVVHTSYVTPNFFPMLGVRVARGRTFTEDEGRLGAGQPVAVISHDLWQSLFGADERIIGRVVDVAGQRYTIIGVAAAGFTGVDLDRSDLWLPLSAFPWRPVGGQPGYLAWRSDLVVRALARLHPGTTAATVAAVATRTIRQGEAAHVSRGADTTAQVLLGPILESLGPSVTPSTASAIVPRLVGVALIVLVVACANVSNLLLLRAQRRRREIAVRLAVGISRRRLVGQLLLESLTLAAIAAVVAVILGWWGARLLRTLLLPSVHWASNPFGAGAVAAAFALALVAGLAAGLAPARRALDADLSTALKAGAREGTRAPSFLRTSLLIVQTALSVILLVGAGLFVKSFDAVRSIDLGYDTSRVLYGYVKFRNPETRVLEYSLEKHAAELAAGFADVARRLDRSPNIDGTALSRSAPMAMYSMIRLFLVDGTPAPHIYNRDPVWLAVSPRYRELTGMRLARGRFFTDEDRAGAPPVVVVNETAARTLWPGREALGQCVIVLRLEAGCSTVVGVVHDTHVEEIMEPPTVEAFSPLAQQAGVYATPALLVVRARPGKVATAEAEVRSELRRVFPSAEPPTVRRVDAALEPQLRPWRLGSILFGLFGALALVIATLGIYSAMAFTVTERRHELGVRMALGAQRKEIVNLVVSTGLRPVLIGLVVGVGLSLLLGRFVSTLLYGVVPNDVSTQLGVCSLLIGAAVVGILVPVARATAVHPTEALRAD